MITAGLDMGYMNVKVVIMKDGKDVIGSAIKGGGLDVKGAANEALAEAMSHAKVTRADISKIVVTGSGRSSAPYGDEVCTDITADAKGAYYLYPTARTIIDVGAEEGKSIRLDANGKVKDFATNEKCGAGAGAFLEAMSRALEVSLVEMSKSSLTSTKDIPMNAQCAVFAESEVVSLIHAKTAKSDIARAVYDGLSSRIQAMALKTGIEKDIVLIGGVANSEGFIESLKRGLKSDIVVAKNPQIVAAIGAAMIAAGK